MLRLMMAVGLLGTIALAGGCSGSLTANGAAGNVPDASTCVLGKDAPALWARGVGPQGLTFDYDGPAFVGPSTTDTLSLTISVPADAGTGADAGAGTTTVQITGMNPMPAFPVGATVWLTKSKDPMAWFGPPQSTSFAIRNGQGGPLLLAGAVGPYGPLSFPVKVDQLVVTCTQRDQGCAPNSTISFAGATVTGDKAAFIETDQVGSIQLGGALYEVRLYAANEPVVQPVNCTDFFGLSEVQIDVRATNLASLIASLPVPVPLNAR